MDGGWREADNGTESPPRRAGGQEQQLDGGAAYDWAGDSESLTLVSSSAEATRSAHEGCQDRNDDAGVAVNTEDKKARRDFYTNFTERALANCGGNIAEVKNVTHKDSVCVEHEQIAKWRTWVDLTHRVPSASVRLICCPWAGGNSLAFESWAERLPGVEVVPILLPGRLTRAYESALTSISDIVTMVVEALRGLHLLAREGIPVFAFGHEFGALVAFEICRRVQADFPVEGLFVSGMTCPQMAHKREKMSTLCQTSPDGQILHAKNFEFEDAMLRRGSVPPELRENKDLMGIFTPLWFADLSAVDLYEYLSGTVLECPIYSFGGMHDGEQDIGAWAMETSSDRSESVLYPGGGFYLLHPDNEEKLLQFLRDRFNRCIEEGKADDESWHMAEGNMHAGAPKDGEGSESSG